MNASVLVMFVSVCERSLTLLPLQDRRAEMVRANKERIMAAEKQDAASSG